MGDLWTSHQAFQMKINCVRRGYKKMLTLRNITDCTWKRRSWKKTWYLPHTCLCINGWLNIKWCNNYCRRLTESWATCHLEAAKIFYFLQWKIAIKLTSSDILDKLLQSKSFTQGKLPDAEITIFTPTRSLDNGKAVLMFKKLTNNQQI